MFRNVKMLVADDSTSIHAIFREAAAARTCRFLLIEADNGRECMDLLGRGDIDIAFIDVYMPAMSGLEALTNARFMGNKAFVTLMSGRADERCFELARELNAYEFLTKPFQLGDVLAIMKTFERTRLPMRALIVDDSVTVRGLVRRVLDRSIFRIDVEEAGDGEAAVARCHGTQFDLVFLDCNMPGLDGMATLRQLRQRNETAKVVMISAERDGQREREAMASGAAAFLHKPFYPATIDSLVHQMFGLRPPRLTIVKPGVLNHFDVNIVGRTIAVSHKDSGHTYQYLWFRDPPHLRSTHIKRNETASVDPGTFRPQAEKAAVLELRSARLVN
jgi:CheY-like chemotaxis protein